MEVDRDRPHFRTGSNTAATSELFICFSSRLSSSSSSMKLSKSILSPGRAARDGPVALSSSLSRRLRTNGSLKGGASPFFTASGKKKGCAYENPEPSSPKVTCIGQVRVKTKKKVKQSRSLSNRRSGEASFRKIDHSCGEGGQLIEDKWLQRCSNASGRYQQECLPHRNQRWVHLPVSICEALRAEFSCLFPCKSSCFSNSERDQKCVKQNGNENGCGAVFARWMVSVNDGEGGNRREIELVVGGGDGEDEEEEEAEAERISIRSSRRHVFEDIEVKDDRIELKGQRLEGEEEDARVSICIPPKNALLLMRCRSDPMKMANLANRFSWDGHAALEEEKEEEKVMVEEDIVVCEEHVEDVCQVEKEVFEAVSGEPIEEKGNPDEVGSILEVEQGGELCTGEEIQEQDINSGSEEMVGEKAEILEVEEEEEEMVGEKTEIMEVEEKDEEVESNMSSFEALLFQENTDHYENCPVQEKEAEEDEEYLVCHLHPSDSDEENVESETEQSTNSTENDSILSTDDRDNQLKSDSETTTGNDGDELEEERATPQEETAEELESSEKVMKTEKGLPECLLLMMREPKLSMEVSKETWVCSTDFIRWLPEKPSKPAKADEEPVKEKTIGHAPPSELHQPPRSSCSLPAVSMATMLEQRLVNAVAYEPFVLTRCKSEPMRSAAVKLMPESCFWKNAMRKLEPHRQGVGAAGIGF